MGFLVSQHGQLGAIPPPRFLSVSPFESMRSGGAIPPPTKGYLSNTCAIPFKTKQNACDTPLCDTISKGYCAIWGCLSHWSAKVTGDLVQELSGTPRPLYFPKSIAGTDSEHTVNSAKNPSQKAFLDPPPTIRFPPPLFWRLSVISLKTKRRRPDQPQFLRPPKVVLESTLCSTFCPPPSAPSAAAQQMGGVLRYKLEAYCRTNWRCIAAFPLLQSL